MQKMRENEFPHPKTHLRFMRIPCCQDQSLRMVLKDEAKKRARNWKNEIHENHSQNQQERSQEQGLIIFKRNRATLISLWAKG